MPRTEVVFFQDENGSVPVLEWLESLPERVQDKVMVRLERLSQLGHELRRPEADFLRDKIYELRIRRGKGHYRVLYFFSGSVAVLVYGLVKERQVPPADIDRAVIRKMQFDESPRKHTYRME